MGSEASEQAGDGTYIGFLVLTGLGVLLALTLCRPREVIRSDGSKVVVPEHPSWRTEFIGLWKLLLSDTYVIGLFPMFLASNWFYTYQFNVSSSSIFDSHEFQRLLTFVGFQSCEIQHPHPRAQQPCVLGRTDFWCNGVRILA